MGQIDLSFSLHTASISSSYLSMAIRRTILKGYSKEGHYFMPIHREHALEIATPLFKSLNIVDIRGPNASKPNLR